MEVVIRYLGEIEIETGRVHDGWAGGRCYDGSHVPTRRVEPTVVTVEAPPECPQLLVGWGDRSPHEPLPVYTDRDAPEWAPAVAALAPRIREAAAEAESARSDVRAVVEHYRALVDAIDAQYERLDDLAARRQASRSARELYPRRRVLSLYDTELLISALLASGYEGQSLEASAWARMARGHLVVSALGGGIRYDEPGAAHPQHHAEVALVDRDASHRTRDWARRHADRIFLVAHSDG